MADNLKELLRKHGFAFKKAYGQNFLTDTALLDEIAAAGVSAGENVLEIGCGAGALTAALCRRAKKVLGYEIDLKLKPILDDALSDLKNVEIIYKDIMKEKISDVERRLGGEYVMAANLPYYITTPIIMEFLEKSSRLKAMVIMVQEEVAKRLAAKAGTSDYGAITVGINLRGDAEIIKKVPREMFTPAPNVDSAVVKITIDKGRFLSADLKKVRELVRCGFSSRRKTLANNIINFYKIERKSAESALAEAGIDVAARGETLTAAQYVRLAEILYGEI